MSTPMPTEDLSRRQQMVRAYRNTKKTDPKIGPILLGTFLLAGLVGFGLFWLLPGTGWIQWVFCTVGFILFGALGAMIVFGRRAQRAAYQQMEGQRGAAAAALGSLRRGWNSQPVVGFTKQQDVVHRVVGPPGVVLVGEGNHNRVAGLLAKERRRHERVLAETPVHEVICGNEEGEIPLEKLVKHVTKLGRSVKPAQITDIQSRLRALDANRPSVPMPKGPMPQNMKGMRGQMRGR